MMSRALKTFTKNISSQLVVQILLAARALIMLPILAKSLGELSYGIWSQIVVTVTLFASVLTLRFDIVLVRFFSTETGSRKFNQAFYSMLLLIGIMLSLTALLFILFSDHIAFAVFGDAGLYQYAQILLGLLAIRTIYVFSLSYYRSRHKIVLYSTIQSLQILGEIVLLFFYIVEFESSFLEALTALLIFNAGIMAITLLLVVRELGIGLPNPILLKPYILFALPLIPNVGLSWIINFSDRYIITHLIDLDSAGIYAASYALGQFVNFITGPITFVLYPMISKLWEEQKSTEVKFWMINSLRLFLFFAIPTVFGIHYFAPFVLKSLATEQIAAHRWLPLFVSGGFLFLGVYQIYLYLMHLKQQTVSILIIFTLMAILNVVLNLLLVPLIGIEGAAVATIISYLTQAGVIYIFSTRGFPVTLPVQFIFKALLSTAFMVIFLSFFYPNSLLKSLILIMSGCGIYCLAMILTGAVEKKEIRMFRKILPL